MTLTNGDHGIAVIGIEKARLTSQVIGWLAKQSPICVTNDFLECSILMAIQPLVMESQTENSP